MISDELVVDHALRPGVPQGRHRHLAGVARVARRIGLVQVVEIVHRVGRAIGKVRVLLERPALLTDAGHRIGDADRAFELLDRAVDEGAMRPRAVMRDVEVIAAGLRLETGRAVGGDAVAEAAVDALELAVLRVLDRQFLVAPLAVDQNAHDEVLFAIAQAASTMAAPSPLSPHIGELRRHNLFIRNVALAGCRGRGRTGSCRQRIRGEIEAS